MGKRAKASLPWLIGGIVALLFFVLLSQTTYFRYENSDDGLILKGFMGFEGGTPRRMDLYTGTALAHLLAALGRLMPAVPWFSLFQLLLLWASCMVLLQALWRLGAHYGHSGGLGFGTGVIFLGVFAYFACCRLTYTTTAALAASAALLQLFTLRLGRPSTGALLWRSLPALGLLMCAYSLRTLSALPTLVFILLGLLAISLYYDRLTEERSHARLFFLPIICIGLCLGALFVLRYWETSQPGVAESFAWHGARTSLFDYTSFEQDPFPALGAAQQAGISASQLALIQEWYFMDANTTTQALQQMALAYPQQDSLPRLWEAVQASYYFLLQNPRYMLAALLLVALCLVNLLCRRKRQFATLATLSVAGLLFTAAMLVYLAYQGRILGRAVDAVFFPAAALQCGLLMMGLPALRTEGMGKRILIVLGFAVCLTLACTHIAFTAQTVSDRPDAVSAQREDELERYALRSPDKLILRTPNLLRDTRLFPDVSAGVPGNIMVWGGLYCRMPNWYQQLEAFGVEGESFSYQDWLRPNVLFATQEEAPPQALLSYLSEGAGVQVASTQVGEEGTLRFFQFELSQ